jgi:hypothetical protein
MNTPAEIDDWQRVWQTQTAGPDAADLRERVARETRRKKVALILPIAVTLGIGGWMASRAAASDRWQDLLLAVETWTFIAVLWAVALWLERGTWRPLDESTAAFVSLSIRRCEAVLTGLRVSTAAYLAQLACILSWQLWYAPMSAADVLGAWPMIVLGWLGVPAFLLGTAWYGRRKRLELDRLIELRRQLTDPESISSPLLP